MTAHEQRQYCLSVMKESPACYLSTLDDEGAPEIRAMLNLKNARLYPGLAALGDRHDADFTVWFTTNTSSAKHGQIAKHPPVAVYYCLPESWQGVLLKGKMEIVADPALKQSLWQAGWELYYPGGVIDPDYTVLRLMPDTVKAYGNLSTFSFAPGAA
jgi:general stress protein 26